MIIVEDNGRHFVVKDVISSILITFNEANYLLKTISCFILSEFVVRYGTGHICLFYTKCGRVALRSYYNNGYN